MSQRFFVASPIHGDQAELTSTEAQHASKVMRCRVGDQVTLFDDSGAEFSAEITHIDRTKVRLQVGERRPVDRELPVRLTLGVALPKGDRQRWLVEKGVELGVARLVPLITERGVAQPSAKALDRLRRAVVEASKQCGRNRLMQIAEPASVADYCRMVPRESCRFLASPGGRPWPAELPRGTGSEVAACIGPEGGLTAEEEAAAVGQAWTPVSLGQRILRIETAAIAVAAVVAVQADS